MFGIIRKEFYHIFRDYRTLMILFLMPVIQMIMFGYALNMEIQRINLSVQNLSGGQYSRELIRVLQGSRFFHLVEVDPSNIETGFFRRTIRAHLTIPEDFDRKFSHSQPVQIDAFIDASNSSDAQLVEQYLEQAVRIFENRLRPPDRLVFSVNPVFRYNPELKSSYFMVPGLLALLMIMITALLTSITLVREKETGTFTLLKLSPLRSWDIILGKLIPYLLLSVLIATTILLVGTLLFHVPVKGNLFMLYLFILIYSVTGLGLGMLISSIAKTQQVAMLAALLVTILPTLILSGFLFPLESMPAFLQWISHIIPARYFLVLVRGNMIKDNTLVELLKPLLQLLFFGLLFIVMSVKKFRQFLEK